ncbi:MAG: hypothetical protein U1E76_10245 [Planctomycetota bacterium]
MQVVVLLVGLLGELAVEELVESTQIRHRLLQLEVHALHQRVLVGVALGLVELDLLLRLQHLALRDHVVRVGRLGGGLDLLRHLVQHLADLLQLLILTADGCLQVGDLGGELIEERGLRVLRQIERQVVGGLEVVELLLRVLRLELLLRHDALHPHQLLLVRALVALDDRVDPVVAQLLGEVARLDRVGPGERDLHQLAAGDVGLDRRLDVGRHPVEELGARRGRRSRLVEFDPVELLHHRLDVDLRGDEALQHLGLLRDRQLRGALEQVRVVDDLELFQQHLGGRLVAVRPERRERHADQGEECGDEEDACRAPLEHVHVAAQVELDGAEVLVLRGHRSLRPGRGAQNAPKRLPVPNPIPWRLYPPMP